ncbi:MAG: hypothetical protein ABSA09_06925 [Desulfobaccales bacterium]|jgi:hypothetical protein
MKTMALLVLVISLLGCAPQEDLTQQWQKALDQEMAQVNRAWEPYLERGTQLTRDYNLFKQEAHAWKIKFDKNEQGKTNFLATLSDKELRAYSAVNQVYNQALAGHEDEAGLALAANKLMDLLSASGKFEAWAKLMDDGFALGHQRQALLKKLKELRARDKQLTEDEQSLTKMYEQVGEENERWEQSQQTINALQGIRDQLFWQNWR